MFHPAARAAPADELQPPIRAVIAGGYTGGHIQCALAIAAGLRAARPGSTILMAGARGGPEIAAARAAGYPIETVWIDGIDRRRSARGLARNLLLPLKLAVSFAQARRALARFRPDVVVGVGAFPSAPIVAAAQRAGVPTLLHEANAQPGIANKLLARRASVVCVGVEQAARWFPAGRTLFTGNPTRPGLAGVGAAAARARFGLDPARPTLLVIGGSLGSAALNRWVLAHQQALPAQLLWASGRERHAACAAALDAGAPIKLLPFLDDMAAAYGAADLVVTAGGALTLAELAALGKPAVVVPAGDVSEGHQHENARRLERVGVPVCGEEQLDARLGDLVTGLLSDAARLRGVGARLRELAQPDATERIVAEIVRLAGRDRP